MSTKKATPTKAPATIMTRDDVLEALVRLAEIQERKYIFVSRPANGTQTVE